MKVVMRLSNGVDDVASEARALEDAGFDGLTVGEHVFFHGPIANAFVSLAAAAGATERIRLLSALTILPMYPAALAAKLAASLDRVSGGRFDLGVGVGGEYPPEWTAVGVDPAERGARTDEALEVLRALFTGEEVTHDGRFTSIPGLALAPPPVQRHGPPLWMGGRRPAAMRRAGRHADHWLPYMYDPDRLATSLAQVREEAERAGRDPATVHGAIYCWGAVGHDGAAARAQAVETVGRVYQQDFESLADRYLLVGDPERVVARAREYADAGAETLVFSPASRDVGGPSEDAGATETSGAGYREMVDLFAAEVLPRLSGSGVPASP